MTSGALLLLLCSRQYLAVADNLQHVNGYSCGSDALFAAILLR
jgi:hypothetical protein